MNVISVGNFGMGSTTMFPAFQNTGKWYEFWSGDSMNVTNTSMSVTLQAGEYKLYTTKRLPRPDLSSPILAVEESIIAEHLVGNAYPNPTTGEVNIPLTIVREKTVSFTVTDLSGRTVFNSAPEFLKEGNATVKWNSTTNCGERVTKGTYFIHLQGENLNQVRQIVVQ
jgi:hypothetical protein